MVRCGGRGAAALLGGGGGDVELRVGVLSGLTAIITGDQRMSGGGDGLAVRWCEAAGAPPRPWVVGGVRGAASAGERRGGDGGRC
jgi:hypothetical protein